MKPEPTDLPFAFWPRAAGARLLVEAGASALLKGLRQAFNLGA